MNMMTASLMLETITKDHVFKNDISGALSYGLPKALFGFATVFAVLVLIWGILALFKVFFYTIPEARKNSAKKTAVKTEEKVEKQAEVQAATPVATAQGDAEITAVIMAAIEAYRASEGASAPSGFRVVSFKKRI